MRIWTSQNAISKGEIAQKELHFEIFRAAGAPILGFLGHNPKFSTFTVVNDPPPYLAADLVGRGGRLV